MTVEAQHILIKSEDKIPEVQENLTIENFTDMAKEYSCCNSGARGGSLGTFGRGQMVKEFDEVVFSAPVGEVQGPVETQFGFHLVEVTSRED